MNKPAAYDDIREADVLAHLATYESCILYPYLDSVGVITVGYGHNCDDLDAFMDVPFQINGRAASDLEKQAVHAVLKSHPDWAARGARAFEQVTALSITPDIARELAFKDAASSMRDVVRAFPDVGGYPSPVKFALFDMMYNMGGARFCAKKWPRFFNAVQRRDFTRAAILSRRKKIGAARNGAIKKYLEEGMVG